VKWFSVNVLAVELHNVVLCDDDDDDDDTIGYVTVNNGIFWSLK